MLCCEDGCGYTAIHLDRCPDHAIEYRRKHPDIVRQHDEVVVRDELAAHNAYGKELLARLKEGHHGQGQDT